MVQTHGGGESNARPTKQNDQVQEETDRSEAEARRVRIFRRSFDGVRLIKNLSAIRNDILQETNSLQNYVDDMRKMLTPVQVAKLVLRLEKERNAKELSSNYLWPKSAMRAGDEDEVHQHQASERLIRIFRMT